MAAIQQSTIPPPATIPNSATPGKSVSPITKNARAVLRAPVVMPGPTLRAVSSRAVARGKRLVPQTEVLGDVVDAEIASQADDDRAERAAEDVQMPDGQGDVAERPGHGQHAGRSRP